MRGIFHRQRDNKAAFRHCLLTLTFLFISNTNPQTISRCHSGTLSTALNFCRRPSCWT
jgi:hypothetical protein